MILLCGIADEDPMAMVRANLDYFGLEYVMLDQRNLESAEIEYELQHGHASGYLSVGRKRFDLEDCTGVYTRMFATDLTNAPRLRRIKKFQTSLATWMELTE